MRTPSKLTEVTKDEDVYKELEVYTSPYKELAYAQYKLSRQENKSVQEAYLGTLLKVLDVCTKKIEKGTIK